MARWWAIFALTPRLLFPQASPTIRTETRMVQIDVEVRDGQGKPVAGLSKDDFTVADSGKPRAIQIFSVEGAAGEPGAASTAIALPPNVFSNHSAISQRPPHSTVILLDAINNYWDDFASARVRLLATLSKLTKSEHIAVYMATTQPAGITVIQDFTTDRDVLTGSLQKFRPPPIKPVPGPTRAPPTPPAEEDARRRNAVLDTMSAFRLISEHLGKLPGRKSLLWVTSGLPPKQIREMPEPYEKAAAALNDADIAVNVMDDDGVGDIHRRWGRESFWTLRQLADRTGGKTWTGRNDLENMLTEAIEEPRITYTLGFYLPDEELDDKFHRLAVRINQPKLNLRYRKGYYAGYTAPKKREPLENALLDPRDSDEIPITAELHSVPNAMLRISLRVGLPQLSLHGATDEWSTTVEVMFLETNAAGNVVARVTGGKVIKMSQSQRERFEREGIPLAHELKVMEGATQLVILLRDTESGRTGRLSVPLKAAP